VVMLNAGAALVIAGRANDVREGLTLAGDSIDSRGARLALDRLIAVTNDRPLP
jgi:anthranilate phosphoribosyltransferase